MDWKPKLQFSNFYPKLALPPLNLIKHQCLLHHCCCSAATILLLRSYPNCCCWLLLLLLRSSDPWSQSHTVNLRNFSPPSSSYFFFFCLCYIALCHCLSRLTLLLCVFYELWWTCYVLIVVFQYLWVVAFHGLVTGVLCHVWTTGP